MTIYQVRKAVKPAASNLSLLREEVLITKCCWVSTLDNTADGCSRMATHAVITSDKGVVRAVRYKDGRLTAYCDAHVGECRMAAPDLDFVKVDHLTPEFISLIRVMRT